MACEICKDKISSELENIIGKDRVEFIKKHSSKDRVISKGGFFGFEKQEAYDNFLDPSVSVEECPAKLVLACTQSVVVTDLK